MGLHTDAWSDGVCVGRHERVRPRRALADHRCARRLHLGLQGARGAGLRLHVQGLVRQLHRRRGPVDHVSVQRPERAQGGERGAVALWRHSGRRARSHAQARPHAPAAARRDDVRPPGLRSAPPDADPRGPRRNPRDRDAGLLCGVGGGAERRLVARHQPGDAVQPLQVLGLGRAAHERPQARGRRRGRPDASDAAARADARSRTTTTSPSRRTRR
jgi:hypothetical protein